MFLLDKILNIASCKIWNSRVSNQTLSVCVKLNVGNNYKIWGFENVGSQILIFVVNYLVANLGFHKIKKTKHIGISMYI